MKTGFTLIELMIAILILGILAALLIPKYIDVRKNAIEAQEEYIIGSLREAVYTYYVQHNGETYNDNPFDLLEISPPNRIVEEWPPTPDGSAWVVYLSPFQPNGRNGYTIACPHCNGTDTGKKWDYCTRWGMPNDVEGKIDLILDLGH